MLIVLEGCDGAGKTTVANNLAKVMNADIIHCTTLTPNDMRFFHELIMASREKNVIADRFCYGQFVYQEEKERPLGSIKNLHKLEVEMMAFSAKVIYVTADKKDIEERLSDRGETLINGLTISEVKNRFESVLFEKSLIAPNVLVWDTSKGGIVEP